MRQILRRIAPNCSSARAACGVLDLTVEQAVVEQQVWRQDARLRLLRLGEQRAAEQRADVGELWGGGKEREHLARQEDEQDESVVGARISRSSL